MNDQLKFQHLYYYWTDV